MPKPAPASIAEDARRVLDKAWAQTLQSEAEASDKIPRAVIDSIGEIVSGNGLTYRYILLTQALAKATDPHLNALCLQAKSKLKGAFDARSLCKDVVVDFDRANESVLGGSGDPYVSKPARIPELADRFRKDQKDRKGFDRLVVALEFLESNSPCVEDFLLCVLRAVRKRLDEVRVGYPIPKRVSAPRCYGVVSGFLSERSGGLRMQAIAVALFRTIGSRFQLFANVHSANINAADAATGQVADLECRCASGDVVLAVEVKDRQLTLIQAQEKVPAIRAKGITEFVFLVQGGVLQCDSESISDLSEREFASGQNFYVCEFNGFLETCLVLFGEDGRRDFLKAAGEALDESKADVQHRRAWRDCLASL